MNIRGLSFLPLVFSFNCLACCGQSAPGPYASLDGNWRLSTSGDTFAHPDQYFTIAVSGSTILAQGTLSLSCTRDGKPNPMEPGVYLRGEVHPDGSFTLQNPESAIGMAAHGISISGRLPSAGRWSGSITVAAFQFQPPGQSPRDCPATSADFSATALPLVDGTYSGSIHTDKSQADGYVTLTISQGKFSPVICAGRYGREIQVGGRIVVTGSSLFPTGAYETEDDLCGHSIYGKRFQMSFFHKGDSAAPAAQGDIDPPGENGIRLTLGYDYRDAAGKRIHLNGWVPLTRDDEKASR